jgi:regulator of nucleoside diphosphate kinase
MIRGILASHAETSNFDTVQLTRLRAALERALVLESERIPADVVTSGSGIRVLDLASGKRHEIFLVLPLDADRATNRISIFAPLGTALLGHRAGDEVEWLLPVGLRRLRIEHVFRVAGAAAPHLMSRLRQADHGVKAELRSKR